MSGGKNMSQYSFLEDIFPTCADDYNSATTNGVSESLDERFTSMCKQIRDSIVPNELSESEKKLFDLGCLDILVYLDRIKNIITEQGDTETYVNLSCNYFFYKLKFLMNSCKLKCSTINTCYEEMRKIMNGKPDYEHAFDVCVNKDIYQGILNENIFGMMTYIDFAFYSLYLLKRKTEYSNIQKATHLSNIKTLLSKFKRDGNVSSSIIQMIQLDYDRIIQETRTQLDNTDYQISQNMYGTKSVQVMGNELPEMIVIEEDNAISKEIITTLIVSIFAIMIIIFIGYKYRAHIPFLKQKAKNIMKMKNKQNENINSFATLEGIYNYSIDNKYSLSYSL
ncbi:variable surface protein [Plasmodium gonderi]|uniref:Variable surface protein n=1 Tax=Plasmodium gonderi TaxID=77519 RepID=A0A1Y1JNY2_PLAGO|nr:variable surface protein [Plasmodium gonderi]GAW84191.1 variable surface protein [Plasmodium gonderi]